MKLSELNWYDPPPEVPRLRGKLMLSQPLERLDGVGNDCFVRGLAGWQAWRSTSTPYTYALVYRDNSVDHEHERFNVDAFTMGLILRDYRPAPNIIGGEPQ